MGTRKPKILKKKVNVGHGHPCLRNENNYKISQTNSAGENPLWA